MRMKKYREFKNVHCYYKTFVGYTGWYLNSDKDCLMQKTEYLRQNEGKDVIVCNDMMTSSGGLVHYLQSNNVLKEFALKEADSMCRDPEFTDGTNFGFFLRSGKVALDQRAIFSTFFLLDNIKKLAEPCAKIYEKGLLEQIEKLGINEHSFIETDIRKMA